MVTHFMVNENIAQNQIDIIMSMLRSWDIDAKVEKREEAPFAGSALPFSTGLWADYDINDQTLRAKAWGTHKRVV